MKPVTCMPVSKNFLRGAVGVAGMLVLAGCAVVNADADGIAIRHSAENKVFVARQAAEHCGQFGKTAVEVQRSPVDTSYLVQTVVTTFACTTKP